MKNFLFLIPALCAIFLLQDGTAAKENRNEADKVIVAYVTSWKGDIPDPFYMTHINYAFGHVNDTFDGVRIDNEERLREIVRLKEINPKLRVLLSVGGWGSGGFSEMVATKEKRRLFAEDCRRVVQEFALDGIDIDWEYPTSSAAGISSSKRDKRRFTLMMKEIRKAIGEDKDLTLATVCSAKYVNFRAIRKYIDFVNIMSYDMGSGDKHHAALFPSDNTGGCTTSEAIVAHLKGGVPHDKLVVGIPFYGRGLERYYKSLRYSQIDQVQGLSKSWDEAAQAPFLSDSTGRFVFGYEDPRSIDLKCQYLNALHLRGAMYWEYSGDNENGDLRKAVYKGIFNALPNE